ncbi:MAG: hypothetical protein ACE5FP_08295 [Gemmatimonadota bacterium]
MLIDYAEMIFALLTLILVGTFILAYPITKRLGRVMEEWIAIRRGGAPERETLAGIETTVDAVGRRLDSIEQRLDLVGERQEFMEALVEQRRRAELPPGL